MIKYFDVHSHLNEKSYNDLIDNAINNLKQNGIFTNVIGFDLDSSIKAIELAKTNPSNIKACIGIHPNNVNDYINNKDIFVQLDKLISENLDHITAVGEIGLDLFYQKENLELQKEFCKNQIFIAKKYNLPIMYHIREAFEEIKPFIIENKNYKQIVHCFTSNSIQAEFYISNNCLLSIPGVVTFKNATDLQEVIKNYDLKHFVAETDSPYLTPVPFRGKLNYPHFVKYVYEKIAEIKNMDVNKVITSINENVKKFFNLK